MTKTYCCYGAAADVGCDDTCPTRRAAPKGVGAQPVSACHRKRNDYCKCERRAMLCDGFGPVAAPQPAQSTSHPNEFAEGQWWLKELDDVVANGTDDQKRAVAVVRHLLRSAHQHAGRTQAPAVVPTELESFSRARDAALEPKP